MFSGVLPKTVADVGPGGPVVTEMRGMNALADDMLKTKMQQLQNRYYGPLAESEMAQQAAQTRLTGQQADWYGPKAQSEISYQQAETGAVPSEIALRQAQQQEALQNVKYAPLKNLVEAQNALRLQNRFGQAYQLHSYLQSLDPASRAAWVASNPESYNQMLQDLQSKVVQQQDSASQNALNQIIKQTYPDLDLGGNALSSAPTAPTGAVSTSALGVPPASPAVSVPVSTSSPIPASAPAQAFPIENATPVTPAPPPIDISKQENFNLMTAHNANRKTVGAKMNTRADASAAFEKYLNNNQPEFSKRLGNILKYSGLLGKGQAGLDALASQSPQAYQDLLWAKNIFVPSVTNQIKMMEGMGGTDKQREEMHNLVRGVEELTLDPNAARNTINRSVENIHQLSDAVFDAAEPYRKGTYKKVYKFPDKYPEYIQGNERVSSADGKRILEGSPENIKKFLKEHTDWKKL